MSRRFFAYLNKVFGLAGLAGGLRDRRQSPRVSTRSCFMFGFAMFAQGAGSLNLFEGRLRQGRRAAWWQRAFGNRPPSADSVGYCLERFQIEGLRESIHRIYTTLQRNHALLKFNLAGWRAMALDGHELFASYKRHCPLCSERTVHTKKGDRIQYYHQVVAAQLVGGPLALPLDAEPVLPGEGEIIAARRLLERVSQNYPKAFDLVTGDGLYANPEFLKTCRRHHKHLLAVLKENHPDLLNDAKALFASQDPIRTTRDKIELERWDLDGFTSWPQAAETVRVIRSRETTAKGGQLQTSDWFWVTTVKKNQLQTETICRMGHARWDIENQGFNSLANILHLDRCFRHHPNAIIAFVLIAFIAYILIQAFHKLNCKPQRRASIGLLALTRELAADFFNELPRLKWMPSKPRPP